MSSNANGSANATGADESRPSREVAYRLFAAEFDDASVSYSESDEERAPNYVVTPTGARVNRLFAVGVLTEVEPVNDDVLRGRIVDPTGAFVSYAGQYQPDEMAFLDRASPPAFVALSGKARTFQPEDSDRVFTSVRPESMSRVDADTRDRWTVSTAEATLERVGVMAAALQSGLRGGTLTDALLAAGVDEPLANGVPLAIDHYGTTPGYLAAVRRLALDALEVVANDRDSVRALDSEPGQAGENADLSALAADLDLSPPAEGEADVAAEAAATDDGTTTAEPTPEAERESETASVGSDDAESTGSTATGAAASAEATESVDATATESVPEFDGSDAADADASTPSADSPPASSDSEDVPGEAASTEPASAAGAAESTGETDVTETTETTPPTGDADAAPSADDGLGDFESDAETAETAETSDAGSELGDFDAGDAASPPTSAADAVEADTDAESDATDDVTAESDVETDPDDEGMYELDADERAQIEEEFGTEFATGSEVAPAGEADIDVPSVDELEDELEEDGDADSESAAAESPSEPVSDADGVTAGEADDGDTADEAAEDVDLEAAAVDAMDALDDGDGASRDAVVARVVDEYGVDPGAVEDAIQSALMSGQCYEPTEDSLKAI